MAGKWGRQADARAAAGDPIAEPLGWWGPVWQRPRPRSVVELIRDGVLPVEVAATLWALLARRASVVVAAGPSGAGKTTLATELLDLLPAGTARFFLRGCYEPFAFLDDPAVVPRRSALLANEISPHLPIYLWGPAVARALAAIGQGFQFVGTAHAASAEAFVGMLAGYPLRVPVADVARVDLMVLLDAWGDGATVWREVRGISTLAPLGGPNGGIAFGSLASRAVRGGPLRVDPAVATAAAVRRGGGNGLGPEIAARSMVLVELAGRSSSPTTDRERAETATIFARENARLTGAAGDGRAGR